MTDKRFPCPKCEGKQAHFADCPNIRTDEPVYTLTHKLPLIRAETVKGPPGLP